MLEREQIERQCRKRLASFGYRIFEYNVEAAVSQGRIAGEAALATDAAAEAQQTAPRVLSAAADAQDDPAGASEDELEVRWGADVGCHGPGGVGSHALAFRRSNA